MRFFLVLVVLANVGLFAYGQGYFGVPPSEAGRAVNQRPPINSNLITLGEPILNPHTVR
ncbi:MAG TPA: hypothetical protein VKZ66_08325 [Pusillimonas sp.]|uniref:hypothetical protein n=1 Tax=unclassified Pusillimonas TaxID=2640016 RepID=UPI0026022212|nr:MULTISPECIES: hypothetical protein [unclassified Pusillimonas]HLU19950.1 hypothetical protein [Pusillimonas sp.]